MDEQAGTVEHLDVARAMLPSLRTIIPRALIVAVLPLVGYSFLRPHVGSDGVALAIVVVFPLADIAYERIRHGRVDPIGMIALVGISIGLGGALAFHGNDLLLKLRDSTLTGVFGLVCLGSLFASKPAMYFLARAFSADGDPDRLQVFDEIWEQPGVPTRFRQVTAVWGVGLLAEAGVRVALALALSTQTFLALSPVVSWVAIGSLIAFTFRRIRQGEVEVAPALAVPDLAGPA